MKTILIKVWSQCIRARYYGLRAPVIYKELKHRPAISNKIRSPPHWYYGPDDASAQLFSPGACACRTSEMLCVGAVQDVLYLHVSKRINCHLQNFRRKRKMASRDSSPEADGANSCWAAHPEVSAHTCVIGAEGEEQQLFLLLFSFHTQPNTCVRLTRLWPQVMVVFLVFFFTHSEDFHIFLHVVKSLGQKVFAHGDFARRNVFPQTMCRLASPSPNGKCSRAERSAAEATETFLSWVKVLGTQCNEYQPIL